MFHADGQAIHTQQLQKRVAVAGFRTLSTRMAVYFLARSRGALEDAIALVALHASASDRYWEKLATHAFHVWNLFMVRKAVLRAGMEMMHMGRQIRWGKKVLEEWRFKTQMSGLMRNAMEINALKLAGRLLAIWSRHAKVLVLVRGMRELLRARAKLELYNKAFGGWSDAATSSLFLKQASTHSKSIFVVKLVKIHFRGWFGVLIRKLHLERIHKGATAEHLRKLTSSALIGWTMWSLTRKAHKNIWQYYVDAFSVGIKNDAIKVWLQAVELGRMSRKFLDEWHHDIKLGVLQEWLRRAQWVKTHVFFADRARRCEMLLMWRVEAQARIWRRLILAETLRANKRKLVVIWRARIRYIKSLRVREFSATSKNLVRRTTKSFGLILVHWFAISQNFRWADYANVCYSF